MLRQAILSLHCSNYACPITACVTPASLEIVSRQWPQQRAIQGLQQAWEVVHERVLHSSSTSSSGRSAAAAQAGSSDASTDTGRRFYLQSRYRLYYDNILYRELILKQNVRHFMEVPKIDKIELVVPTHAFIGKSSSQKWELLLPALGLEYINAQTPVFDRLKGKHLGSANVSGTRVTLTGLKAYAFLEKLSVLVLPNQVGFVGVDPKSFDKHGNLTLRLGSMLNFNDFEEVFDVFEDLKSMQITIVVKNVKNIEQAKLLLSGFAIPFQQQQTAQDKQ